MDMASQMILFANVVDHSSFSAAARSIGVSPSAVSKQISKLEERLGVRLLNRSTRSISLTQEGQSFYERCSNVAAEVSAAEELLSSMGSRPTGKLRVTATVAFAKRQLIPLMPAFLERYADIELEMELSDRAIDFSSNGYDLAIRFSEQIEQTSVVARKLAVNKRVACASPAYLSRNGVPQKPEELAEHNCLRLSAIEDWNDWHFERGGEELVVPARGNFSVNTADAIYYAVKSGLGIARLPTYMVASDIASGKLIRLFPDILEDDASIYAVYASRHQLSPKIRVFIDYLVEALGPVPPWERV